MKQLQRPLPVPIFPVDAGVSGVLLSQPAGVLEKASAASRLVLMLKPARPRSSPLLP